MRIAQVSPLYESVPPRLYGGIERVVSWLTEELVAQEHDVTLFAAGGSQTRAKLYSICDKPVRHDGRLTDKNLPHVLMMEVVTDPTWGFDVIHFHGEYQHLPFTRRLSPNRFLSTTHRELSGPFLTEVMSKFPTAGFVSCSQSQQRPIPGLNWLGTVYHGMPTGLYAYREKPGEYLAFIGRMSPTKGPDNAIAIARALNMPLKMAAKIGEVERGYYQSVIEPRLREYPLAEYIGELDDDGKNELLGNAYALVHPIRFQEPFGLVLIESLACGTPVVAFGNGAIPEVIDHGLTGFVCHDIQSAVDAVQRINEISRLTCRLEFERRFTVSRMTHDYVGIYDRLLNG